MNNIVGRNIAKRQKTTANQTIKNKYTLPIFRPAMQDFFNACTVSIFTSLIKDLLVDGLEGSSGDVTSIDLGDGVASSEETDGGTVVITGTEVLTSFFVLSTSSSSLSYQ